MPQLSLYLDEAEMASLRENAARSHVSLSKYVSGILAQRRSTAWPEAFWDTFGALDDESFMRPAQPDASLDDIPNFDA